MHVCLLVYNVPLCIILHVVNLKFTGSPTESVFKCCMFACVFRVQPISFKLIAENILQDNLQVAS
jgi:hypothetical protein